MLPSLSWYDWLMLAILIGAAIRGAVKGFVWQLAVIVGIVLCFGFSGQLSATLAPMIPNVEPPLNRWVAMLVLYLVFSFLSFAAARVLREWIEKMKFVEYDRHLGAVFGLLKGVVFGLVVTFFVVTYSPPARDEIFNSRSGYAAAIIMDRLHPVMPPAVHGMLEPYIHQLDRPGMDLKYSDHGEQFGGGGEGHQQDPPASADPFDDQAFRSQNQDVR